MVEYKINPRTPHCRIPETECDSRIGIYCTSERGPNNCGACRDACY